LDEHKVCCCYKTFNKNGFRYYRLAREEVLPYFEDSLNRILFVLQGEATLSVDTESYSVAKGTIWFLPSGSPYKVVAKTNASIIVHSFNQTTELCGNYSLNNLKPLLNCDTAKKSPSLSSHPMLTAFLNSLLVYLEKGVNCKIWHKMKHKELFFNFRFFYTREELAAFFEPLINDLAFKERVMKNLDKFVSVRDLAQSCHCTKSSFLRKFKATFHEHPSVWLLEQKVMTVTNLLSDPDIPFCQIIDDCHFSCPSHFTAFCKKQLGMTPTQYRKQILFQGH
jgi:AraC-like DNA-binding protein